MRAFLTRLFERLKAKADRSAAGTPVPAGLDPDEPRGPTARERTLMRRRLRTLQRRRATIESAGDELAQLDGEADALRRALDERRTLDELLASGAVAHCHDCGELAGRRDNVCPNCGAQLGSEEPTQRRPGAQSRNGHADATSTAVTGASSARSSSPPAR